MNADLPSRPAVVIWKGKVLLAPGASAQPVLVRGGDEPSAPIVPVFTLGGSEVAAYILEARDEPAAVAAANALSTGAVFVDVMLELGRFEPAVRDTVLRAIAIERWSNRYRFCPACGTVLSWTSDAVAKICSNPDPKRVHRHFPRLDPAIIVLVTHGDRALLGRAARYPPGFYSTLAGFVEPGESVEAALRREVYEEAGIRVGATRYFDSEPWPFPRSLMLGYFADAASTAITLRDAELEDARWFDREQLAALVARMKAERPFFETIARRLIDAWLAQPAATHPAGTA